MCDMETLKTIIISKSAAKKKGKKALRNVKDSHTSESANPNHESFRVEFNRQMAKKGKKNTKSSLKPK